MTNRKIKNTIVISGLLVLILLGGFYAKKKLYNPKHRLEIAKNKVSYSDIRDGDVIFQTSLSAQSLAIQQATRSKYSHCGIIYRAGDKYLVFEAIQPVKTTPLEEWIARGKDGKFVIKRLKNADEVLTPQTLEKMKRVGETFRGKDYDLTFEWDDKRIYCSELIWKIYERGAGIELGELETLGDFDLTGKAVRAKMKERYGDAVPMDETVISPAAIFNSKLLKTVK